MRGFGGPSKKQYRPKSMSIYSSIARDRELGTFTKKSMTTHTSILSSAWQSNQKKEEVDNDALNSKNAHDLDDKPSDKKPFSN
jgi:hypothetical protein